MRHGSTKVRTNQTDQELKTRNRTELHIAQDSKHLHMLNKAAAGALSVFTFSLLSVPWYTKRKGLPAGPWWLTPLIPAQGRQRKVVYRAGSGQLELHRGTLSQKTKRKRKELPPCSQSHAGSTSLLAALTPCWMPC